MHGIKKFLRSIDLFGVTFSFRYKTKEKYQTSLGGLFIILFIILTLINFKESKSNFAIGLSCSGNPKEKLSFRDLLKLEIRYTKYIKYPNSSYIYDRKILSSHSCTYADFYNKYDKQVDYLGLQNYECIDDNDYSIEGVYADQIFSYFDFSVTAVNDSKKILDELDRFLFENDCKFNLVYTDIILYQVK